jgi:catechol 2,3-dioxygenase-like lactoylglutathione lyase family enzyme
MAINGVKSLVYGVDDLETCIRFYEDFGLALTRKDATGADFATEEGSTILLRKRDDPALPADVLARPAVREMIWGVDSATALAALEKNLSADRKVTKDAAGTLHTTDALGIPIGFAVFERKPITFEQVPVNTPDDVRRWDANRKWYKRAAPRLIHHVGYAVPRAKIDVLTDFYVERLNFRVTDISRGLAMFLLADGRQDHHSIFLIASDIFKTDGMLFNHVSFGVENIDELMAGANHMQRRKWQSFIGLGRHRISSAVNFYIDNPAGGQSEYLTDTDFVTDAWKPRIWNPAFGAYMWTAQIPEMFLGEPQWECEVVQGRVPKFMEVSRPPEGSVQSTPSGARAAGH